MIEKIEDLIQEAEMGANIKILLLQAYSRGYRHGIDYAQDVAVDAMRQVNEKT